MKKTQALGLSIALVGGSVLATPCAAVAVISVNVASGVTCTAATTTSETSTCTGSGGYTGEAVNFRSSAGVSVDVTDTTSDFSACGYHLSGSKSFGMSTGSTAMVTRGATGKTAASGVGCAE